MKRKLKNIKTEDEDNKIIEPNELSSEEKHAYAFADDMIRSAIVEFENDESKMSFADRVSLLRNALIWCSFTGIKMAQKYGASNPEREKQMIKHAEYMKYFAEIEKLYASELRATRLSGRTTDSPMSRSFLRKIKEASKPTVGNVVRNLND